MAGSFNMLGCLNFWVISVEDIFCCFAIRVCFMIFWGWGKRQGAV